MSAAPAALARDPAERFAPGTVIDGRYAIHELLGAGSFGDVYRASQLLFGRVLREVALKVFRQRHVSADNAPQVFADAVTLLGLMDDDPPPEVLRRLVQVVDLGVTREPPGRGYIAMRLVPGRRTLAAEIRRCARGGMPVATTLWYLQRLLVPLAWMHRQDAPLAHGDLKPENILIAPDGEPVLTDFGLAARLPLGVAGGTVPYEAPEVLAQGTGTPSSDVYSLGVIWYEMLAGRAPFDDVGLEALAADDQAAYRRAHHEARKRLWTGAASSPAEGEAAVPSPAEFNPELRQHPQLEAVLARCLAWRASQRFANAGLLLAELERVGAGHGVSDATIASMAAAAAPPPPPAAATPRGIADAQVLLARGDAAAALRIADEALQAQPQNVPALVVHARALLALGRAAEAQRRLGSAYAAAPNDAGLLDAYADLLDATGQRGTAQALRRQGAALRARAASSRASR